MPGCGRPPDFVESDVKIRYAGVVVVVLAGRVVALAGDGLALFQSNILITFLILFLLYITDLRFISPQHIVLHYCKTS